jgi:hypothetical protein
MSDYSRTYQILLPEGATLSKFAIGSLARQQLESGARDWDMIEIKIGLKIVVFCRLDQAGLPQSPVFAAQGTADPDSPPIPEAFWPFT